MRRNQAGMVTAELALSLMIVAVVAMGMVWGIAAGVQQIALGDAAAQIARAQARGDSEGARVIAERISPATVHIDRNETMIVVDVQGRSSSLGLVPALELHAQAQAYAEPGLP